VSYSAGAFHRRLRVSLSGGFLTCWRHLAQSPQDFFLRHVDKMMITKWWLQNDDEQRMRACLTVFCDFVFDHFVFDER
jgi:hypothetical protein